MKAWVAAGVALAGCAAAAMAAQDDSAEAAAEEAYQAMAPDGGLTPQQIVAARQAAYHLSGAAMGNMRRVIESGGDVAGQAYAARGVARWARVLPTMFPDSTRGVGPTRARPEIWANRGDFEAKAAAYAEAAARLAEVAETGDREAFAAQFRATAATCGACHERYQVPLAE